MSVSQDSVQFLNILYLKSRENYKEGYDLETIQKLSTFDRKRTDNVVAYLVSKYYISLGQHKGDNNIYLTSTGLDYVETLKENKLFYILKFNDVRYIPPAARAVAQFKYYYQIINEDNIKKEYAILVIISDVLCLNWGFSFWSNNPDNDFPNLIKILLQYAKNHIIEKLTEGTLNEYEEMLMLSADYPDNPPYEPNNLVEVQEAEFEIQVGQKTIGEEIRENKLAASIIELRDRINAVFYQKNHAKLLLLNEERNLLDFFKTANTEEEFSHRVASLGQVARNLNIEALRKLTAETDKQVQSVKLLTIFLEQQEKDGEQIIGFLVNIGRVRQGYPIHTDIAGVIKGLSYFNITYPIQNFEAAWLTLLSQYLKILDLLSKHISDLYMPLIDTNDNF